MRKKFKNIALISSGLPHQASNAGMGATLIYAIPAWWLGNFSPILLKRNVDFVNAVDVVDAAEQPRRGTRQWESNLPPQGTFLCPGVTFLCPGVIVFRPRGIFSCPGVNFL